MKIIRPLIKFLILILFSKYFIENFFFKILAHTFSETKGTYLIILNYLLNFWVMIFFLMLFLDGYDLLFDFLWNKLILKKKRFH